MDGSALEVALALMRTPSMRVALRSRPLPDGVGEVVELAAGASERVAEAAVRSGESPEDVLEAARFYVREVLLFAGADAYRVLGVAADADDAQVKLHHRHLQQWLHPDRNEQGWESAFAARVNMAWAELRSPSRRAAYDATRALESAGGPDVPRRVFVSDWRPTRAVDDQHWRRWVLPVAAVACCLWLVVLAVRQTDAPGPQWHASSAQEEDAFELPESTIAAVAAGGAVADEVAPRVDAESGLMGAQPADELLATLQDSDAKVARSAAVGNPSPPNPPLEGEDYAPGAGTGAVGTTSPPNPLLEEEVYALVASSDVVGNPSPPNPPLEGEGYTPGAVTGVVGNPSPLNPLLEGEGYALVALSDVGESPSPPNPLLEREGYKASAGASSMPAAATISPQRVRLVRRVGRDLTTYLAGDARRAPPIWNAVAAQDAAVSLREQLGGARFGDAVWDVGADRASMTSPVERRGRHDAAAVLRAEFTWREGLWLVDALTVEEAQ